MEVGFFNFLSCRETSRRISQGLYDEASAPVRILFWIHLIYCRYCRRYLRELRVLTRTARQWAQKIQPQDRRDFENLLIERLSKAR